MTSAELLYRQKRLLAGIAQSGYAADGHMVTVWPKERVNGKEVFSITHAFLVLYADDAATAIVGAEEIVLGREPTFLRRTP